MEPQMQLLLMLLTGAMVALAAATPAEAAVMLPMLESRKASTESTAVATKLASQLSLAAVVPLVSHSSEHAEPGSCSTL